LSFTPDGEAVYFTRTEDAVSSIWQTGVLGGQARKVIDRAHAAVPSPDGRQLAYFVPDSAFEALVVSGVDGTERRELAARVPWFPPPRAAWSQDGRWLSYVRAGLFAPQNLFVVNVTTGEERQVTTYEGAQVGIRQHAWLPGGRYLVADFIPYARTQASSDIALVDIRSGTVERLTASVSAQFARPSLSRDGARLVATSTRTVREVWKVSLASPDPSVNGAGPLRLLDERVDAQWTFASRDGRTLLYAGSASGSRNLWTMPLDGSGAARQITAVPEDAIAHSSLSPDGTRVAFVSFEGGTSDIWVQNVDGSDPRQLTSDAAADTWPVWAPDGERLVYGSARGAAQETRVMSADGSGNVKLFDGFFRGDWIRNPEGNGTLIVTSLGTRSVLRLLDPERQRVIWEKEIPGMGFTLPMFSSDGRRISALFQEPTGRTGIAVLDAETGAERTVAWLAFPASFRAIWVDGDQALIVNRVEPISHIVLFEGFWRP